MKKLTLTILSMTMFMTFNTYADSPAIGSSSNIEIPKSATDNQSQSQMNSSPGMYQPGMDNITPQQQQSASPVTGDFKEGVDYYKLKNPLPSTGNSIDVINFFTYGCETCLNIKTKLDKWALTAPYYVRVIDSPVSTNDQVSYPARIYFSLEQINQAKINGALMNATSVGKMDFKNYKILKEWLESRQINIASFEEAFDSGEVISKVKIAPLVVKQYEVKQVPVIVVDGKYSLPYNSLMENNKFDALLNTVIQRSVQEKAAQMMR